MNCQKTMAEWKELIAAHQRGEIRKDASVIEIISRCGREIIALPDGSTVKLYPQNSEDGLIIHIANGYIVMGKERL